MCIRDSQMNHFTEELAELIQAVAELDPKHIAEELADVEVMVEQMEYLLTLDKDTIKRYAAAHEEHDAWMCFWFLAAPIKSINKLRRADLEASTSKRNAAKHSIELAIGDLTSYLDWLVERFGIPTEEILETNPTRYSAPATALRRRPPMVKPEPWENPMLDTMWSFMQMGGLKANYPALKEACMELRQMLMQKTAGQRRDRPKDLPWENLERVKVTIICEAMALVLSGDYEKMEAQHDGN